MTVCCRLVFTLLLMAAACAVPLASLSRAENVTITSPDIEDGVLQQIYPELVSRTPANFTLCQNDALARNYYIKFAALGSYVPPGSTIEGATLEFTTYQLPQTLSGSVAAMPLSRDLDGGYASFVKSGNGVGWVEPGGERIDGDHAAVVQDQVGTTSSNRLTFNLTELVQDWVSGRLPNRGLLLLPRDEFCMSGSPAILGSRAGLSQQPRLKVTYTVSDTRPRANSLARQFSGWYALANRQAITVQGSPSQPGLTRRFMVHGDNFAEGGRVVALLGGTVVNATVINDNLLKVGLPNYLTLVPGQYSLTVRNGTGEMTLPNAVRVAGSLSLRLNSVTPNRVVVWDRNTQLTLNGRGFTPSTQVRIAGRTVKSITYLSESEIRVRIPWQFAAARQRYHVEVYDERSGEFSRLANSLTFDNWRKEGSCLVDSFEGYGGTADLAGVDPYISHDRRSLPDGRESSPWMLYSTHGSSGLLQLDDGDAAVGDKSMAIYQTNLSAHLSQPDRYFPFDFYYRYNNRNRADTIPCASGTNRFSFWIKLPFGWRKNPARNYGIHFGDFPFKPGQIDLQSEGRHFYRYINIDDSGGQWQKVELNLIPGHERNQPPSKPAGVYDWINSLQTRFYLQAKDIASTFTDLEPTVNNPLGVDFVVKIDEVEFRYDPDLIEVRAPVSKVSVGYGTEVEIPVTVKNTGSQPRYFGLDSVCQGQYWTTKIYRDLDRNGRRDPGSTEVTEAGLPAGATYSAVVVATVPDSSVNIGKKCEVGFWAQEKGGLRAGGIHVDLDVTASKGQISRAGRPVIYSDNLP